MNRAAGVLLPAAVCLALGFVLGRQSDDDGARAPDGHLAVLTRDLSLRPDQVAALSRLLAEQDRDLQELVDAARAQLSGPTAARLQRTEDEMLAMLDPDQQQRYLSLTTAPEPGAGR